jgi:RimJ/RimL family protein N-acetyltransferase
MNMRAIPISALPQAGLRIKSVEESREVIKNVLSGAEDYAVCLQTDNRAIGAIALKLNENTDLSDREDECELGFWIAKPFWGQG